jgi:hypothetical protein
MMTRAGSPMRAKKSSQRELLTDSEDPLREDRSTSFGQSAVIECMSEENGMAGNVWR